MLNLGLKGKQNVDAFNKTMLRVSNIHPQSNFNTSTVLQWVKRNRIQKAIGIAIDVARVTISIIDDKVSVRESTQILLGQIVRKYAGAELGAQLSEPK
jgi:hypothetical protein